MPVTAVRRYQDPNDEAKLLLGFIAVAVVAGVGYICYANAGGWRCSNLRGDASSASSTN